MAEGTIFSDKIIIFCPLKLGNRNKRICDEEECAWWDNHWKRCKVMSFMDSITYAVHKQFPKEWKNNKY